MIIFVNLILGIIIGWVLKPIVVFFEKKTRFKDVLKISGAKDLTIRFCTTILLAYIFYVVALRVNDYHSGISSVLFLLVFDAVIVSLTYLAMVDLLYMYVPWILTLSLILLLSLINILLTFNTGISGFVTLWNGNPFYPFYNLVAGIGIGVITWAFVRYTQEKDMGSGDIYLGTIMGLIIGMHKILIGFYITIISASVIGIVYALYKRQFKGLRIPFVPFIVLGIMIVILFWGDIVNWTGQYI
jgi:prepilin signal peptidase PulO-like enzyme (type II secretory pathway)